MLLAEHFLERHCVAFGKKVSRISATAYAMMTAFQWPGNVRGLENCMERASAVRAESVAPAGAGDHTEGVDPLERRKPPHAASETRRRKHMRLFALATVLAVLGAQAAADPIHSTFRAVTDIGYRWSGLVSPPGLEPFHVGGRFSLIDADYVLTSQPEDVAFIIIGADAVALPVLVRRSDHREARPGTAARRRRRDHGEVPGPPGRRRSRVARLRDQTPLRAHRFRRRAAGHLRAHVPPGTPLPVL